MGSGAVRAASARHDLHLDDVEEAAVFATKGGATQRDLSVRVEINIDAKLNKAANARALVSTRRSQDTVWRDVATTEVISSSKHPKFVASVIIDFSYEVLTRVRVELYDWVSRSSDPADQEFLGVVETTVSEIYGGENKRQTLPLENEDTGKSPGTVALFLEECTPIKNHAWFTMSVEGLNTGVFEKPTCFVQIGRVAQNDELHKCCRCCCGCRCEDKKAKNLKVKEKYRLKEDHPKLQCKCPLRNEPRVVPVYRTETLSASSILRDQPKPWAEVNISVQQLCRGAEARPIVFELFEYRRGRHPRRIARAQNIYTDFMRSCTDGTALRLKLVTYNPKAKNNEETKGFLVIENVRVEQRHNFLDYIANGLDMQFVYALDFTRSNLDPNVEGSLHNHDTSRANDYVMAIRAVGGILDHYSKTKRYPVYGFGARIPPTHTHTSHCFAATGNFMDPCVVGVEEITDLYRQMHEPGIIKLHGPTLFHEVVNIAANWARPYANPPKKGDLTYTVMVIITDGVVNDLQAAIDAIVEAGKLPISIIIVGVGHNDFSQMHVLDADEEPLVSSKGEVMCRDIVQFVAFEDFVQRPYHELAIAVLDEVPREVVKFFTSLGIPPVRPIDEKAARRKKLAEQNKLVIQEEEQKWQPPQWIQDKADQLIMAAVSQGFPRDEVEIAIKQGVPTLSVEHLIDTLAHKKGRGAVWKTGKKLLADEDTVVYSLDGVCRVCWCNPIDCRVAPCKHQWGCYECLKTMKFCQTCNERITKVTCFGE